MLPLVRSRLGTALCAVLSLSVPIPGSAQFGSSAATDADASVTELSTVLVGAKAEDEAQFEGPFGPARAVQDTPRAVTALSSEQLSAAAVVELRDLQRLVPNSYGANSFGAASLPSFRGQLGEVFQDGLRRIGGNNGLGLPLSFNSFEQVDAVKGPPPVLFGATQRVGGFVNLIPKRAEPDQASAALTLGAGTWDRYRQTLDLNQPLLAGRSALRLSLENRNEGSFYDFARYESQSLYGAYRYRFGDDRVLDVNLEYFEVDFADIAGFNRATQSLIDDGLYITGQGRQENGSEVPAAFSVVSPTGAVRLPRNRVLTDPLDINNAQTFTANLRYRQQLTPALSWTQRVLYQHVAREEIAQNSFVEIIDGADQLDARSEFSLDYAAGPLGLKTANTTSFGVQLRYHDVLGYSQFTTEADNPIDLSGPIENRRIPLTAEQQARLVALRPGLYVSPGAQYDIDGDGSGDFSLSDTTDSTTYQLGLFLQQSTRFSQRWELLWGLRADGYEVTARDGAPPPGVSAARDDIQRWLTAGNAALLFKPLPQLTTYLSASDSESTSNSLGGGFVLGADNRISGQNFATESRLYEAGVKWASPDGRWTSDLVLFDQTRSLRNRDGSNSGIKTQGIESQLIVRSDKAWFAQLSAAYLDARYDDSAAFQDSRSVLDAFDDSRPDIVVGTGAGSPNFAAFPASDRRLQGLPRLSGSALLSWQSSRGLGASLSAVYTDEFPLDYLQTVKIREQVTVNAAAHWRLASIGTSLRIDVYNLTDEENFSPVFDGGYFGSTLVFPEPPINLLFSVRHDFRFS